MGYNTTLPLCPDLGVTLEGSHVSHKVYTCRVEDNYCSKSERVITRLFLLIRESRYAQLVKASVGQADVQGFEPHLGHNCLSCGVFIVMSRHFGLPLAQTLRPNW